MAQTKAQLLGPVVGDVVMDVSTLSLDAEGNKVGIGTTGATATLHVFEPTEGDAVVQFNSGDNFPTVNRGLVLKAATGPTGYTGSKWIFDAQSSGGRLEFQTASTPRLTILEGGNLQVKGGNLHLDSNAELALFEDNTSGSYTNSAKIAFDFSGNVARMRSSVNGSATTRPLAFYIANTPAIFIGTDGKIGINETSPTAHLVVKQSGNTFTTQSQTVALFQRSSTAGHGAKIAIVAGTGGSSDINFGDTADEDIGIIQYYHTDNSLRFTTNTSEALRIDSSGRTLIGLDSSLLSYAGLQIKGDIDNGAHICLANKTATPSGGHNIGSLRFTNNAGGIGALINVEGDGTWSGSSYPSRIIFATTASGSTSGTQRLLISSAGDITLGYAGTSLYFQNGFNNSAARIQNGGGSNNSELKFLVRNAGTESEKMRLTSTAGLAVVTAGSMPANAGNETLYIQGEGHNGHGTSNTRSVVSIIGALSSNGNAAGVWMGARTDDNTAVIGTRTASGNLAIETYNGGWGERLRIKSNGQVLIGNHATHGVVHGNLEVNGNDGINISNATRSGANGAQWRLIPHNGGGSATNLRLYEGAGGVEVLNVTKTGRIGVNRLTPSFMLDIVGNSSTGANCIRITDGAETGHGSHPAKIVAGGTYYHEMQMHSRRFTVHTYDGSSIAERFRVHQTGQVILGTQSPLNSLPGIQMYLGGGDPSIVGCKADNNPAAYVTLLKLAGYSQSSSSFRENAAILFETNTANNSGNASGRILFRTEGLNETNGPSTRAVITAEGKMGIGIEDPSGILDIKSTQTSSLKTFLRLGDSGNGGSYFDFNMSDQSSGADEINHRKDGYVPKNTYGLKISSHSTLNGSYTQAGPASIRWYFPSAGGGNQAGGQLEFWTNQNGYAGTSETKKMQIDNYGNIGAPSGNNIYNASDERLKENIVNLTGCLEKVKQLRPISFTWKDGFGMMSGVSEYGFGAQTTQAVDEILVEPFGEDDIVLDEETIENPLRVNDKYIVPMLVKAVQEQQEQIEALQALVNSLTSSN